jgi:hypothetical protein
MSTEQTTMSTKQNSPVLRVIRGDATDEEIAALLAVLAARSGGAVDGPAERPAAAWADRAALIRSPLRPGPNAWRASAWRR